MGTEVDGTSRRGAVERTTLFGLTREADWGTIPDCLTNSVGGDRVESSELYTRLDAVDALFGRRDIPVDVGLFMPPEVRP